MRAIFQISLGEVPGFYQPCIESVGRYAQRVGAKHIVLTEPRLRIAPLKNCRSENALRLSYLPIYEKQNAFNLLHDFEQVAVIDADIYVRDSAPDLFDQSQAPFAGVLERDLPCTPQHTTKLQKHSQGQFGNLRDVDWDWNAHGAGFYNMGMMLLHHSLLEWLDGQTPTEFLRRPEFERFINGEGHWRWSTDQTLLNWWLRSADIPHEALDWRFNALYGAVKPERIKEAYFVHFFLAAKMPQQGREIPDLIRGFM